MSKKRKRTGQMYYDKTIEKWIIDKAKKDMTCFELDLINKTKLYTNIVPSDNNESFDDKADWEKRLDKRQKALDKKNEKENNQFWDEYYKYLKNPKKYDNKLTKTEKKIMKFFNSKAKKKKNKDKEEKAKKKANKSILDYLIYEQMNQEDDETRQLVESRTGYTYDSFGTRKKRKSNPNKSFFKNNKDDREYNIEKTELLRSLEEEILERLNDESMFDKDNLVVEYSNFDNGKKKKKKSKKDVDRMII